MLVCFLIIASKDQNSASKEFHVCHYWYFLYYRSTFQTNVCNNCQDLFLMSVNLRNITILNIKGSDYHCITILTSKNEAIKLLQSADLTKKSGTL